MDEPTPKAPKVERLAYTAAEACEALGGIDRVTLWRLEKRGLIRAVPGIRCKLYSVQMLREFVNRKGEG